MSRYAMALKQGASSNVILLTTLKNVGSYFPASVNTVNFESITSLHRSLAQSHKDITVHGKIPPHFVITRIINVLSGHHWVFNGKWNEGVSLLLLWENTSRRKHWNTTNLTLLAELVPVKALLNKYEAQSNQLIISNVTTSDDKVAWGQMIFVRSSSNLCLWAVHQVIRACLKNVHRSSEQNFIVKLNSHATPGKQQFWSMFFKMS